MRGLWQRIALVVGLKLARALVALGLKCAKLGDQLGTLTFLHVQRLSQGQQQANRHDDSDPDKTPNDRPPCPGCGRPGGTGHEPNCAII